MLFYTTHFKVGGISLNISFQETEQGSMPGNVKIQMRWFRECMGIGNIPAILEFCQSSYDEEV
jgi:hypothetical protein